VPCIAQESLTGRRQFHRAVIALQQLDSQPAFKQLHLSTQGRLSHVHPDGGTAEVKLFGHGDKTTQLV
jgi:hypothetical protein